MALGIGNAWVVCIPCLDIDAILLTCFPEQFAFTETGYVIVRFCQRFDKMENMEEGDGRIRLHHAIENRSGTGVQVRLHEADYE